MTIARQSDYISTTRQLARQLWDSINDFKALQREYNALDYGTTLEAGAGENEGITATDVQAVVFTTTNALDDLLGQGHATNLAKLL